MIDLNKIGEKFMWQVEMEDSAIINEFYEENCGDINNTPFDEVNNKEEFKELRLISNLEDFRGVKLSVNNKGTFSVLGDTMKFKLLEEGSDKNLLDSELINSLIMYRTAMNSPKAISPIIVGYIFGFKITNDKIFSRVKLMNTNEGLSFRIEITGKESFKASLTCDCSGHERKIADLNIKNGETLNVEIK